MLVGFVVNPIAGMGGAVGLKGTDGPQILEEAVARGAKKVASSRARTALTALRERGLDIAFITCAGEMGEEALREAGFSADVVYTPGQSTSSEDTREAVRLFVSQDVDLVVFVGGDGTARDVISALGDQTPMIGVPSGVKMHSGVFANTPEALADLVLVFAETRETRDADVMDVDEGSFRKGIVEAKLYGSARVPDDRAHVQPGKQAYHSGTADQEAEELGQYMADEMEEGLLYVLGPGSTTAKVAEALGQPKTLLGVDAYRDRRLVSADVSEGDLLKILATGTRALIIVSPIGAQGFVLGRGNQQISAQVVRAAGEDNLVVIATPSKLMSTPVLRVDTGDRSLDDALRKPTKVVTGYRRRRLVTLE